MDVILYKEKAIQEQLQKALDEAKLSNEIIEAIAKSYQYISRIDISKNWFEEISNRAVENMNYKNRRSDFWQQECMQEVCGRRVSGSIS